MITALISLLVMLLGLVVYLASSNGKIVELARLAFAIGLFMSLLPYVGKIAHLP